MPLEFRATGSSHTQFEVYCNELRIARIGKRVMTPLAGEVIRWQWAFSLGNAVPPGFEHHGHVDTFEEAKAKVEQQWRAWLQAAGLGERS